MSNLSLAGITSMDRKYLPILIFMGFIKPESQFHKFNFTLWSNYFTN